MEIKTNTLRGEVASTFAVDGRDGKSAYEVALDNGFEGTETDWLESLKGVDGADGADGFSEYDYIITSAEDFTQEKLHLITGSVLVKDIELTGNLDIFMAFVNRITFVNTKIKCPSLEIAANSGTIEGLIDTFDLFTIHNIHLEGFYKVKKCGGGHLTIHNCRIVEECSAYMVSNCDYVSRFHASIMANGGHSGTIQNCKCVNGVEVYFDDENIPVIDLVNCEYVSNVYGSGIAHYVNCKYVDGDTCKDYYTAEDVGKVQVITADGTKQTANISSLTSELLEQGQAPNSIQQKGTGAKAIGNNSMAFNAAIAGCKGYRYCAIDTTTRKIYLTANNDIANTDIVVIDATDGGTSNQTITPDTSIDITKHYAKGDKFTLKMRTFDLDNAGTIEEIYSNYIVYDDTFAQALETTRLSASKKSTPKTLTQEITTADSYIDRYSFSVSAKPESGQVIVSEDSVAFGSSKAPARYSFAAGRDNNAIGDSAMVFGRNLTGGYQAFVAGYLSTGTGYNYTLGYKCTNEARYAFVTGQGCYTTSDAENSVVGGFGNKATAPNQTIFGKHALQNSNILFGIGNGTSGNSAGLRNAFTVWNDGRVTLSAHPTEDMDATPKQYVDNVVDDAFSVFPILKGTGVSFYQSGSTVKGNYGIALQGGTANSQFGFSCGKNSVADQQYTISLGTNTKTYTVASLAIGYSVETSKPEKDIEGNVTRHNREQMVIGRYNKILPGDRSEKAGDGAAVILGNGTSGNRTNGITVWGDGKIELGNTVNNTNKTENNGLIVQSDGRATIGKDPTENMDVVPKHMYDELLARVEALEAKV